MDSELRIEGMSCDHCVAAVKKALLAVAGVHEAAVTLGAARVTHEAAVRRDALASAVADEGYRVAD